MQMESMMMPTHA